MPTETELAQKAEELASQAIALIQHSQERDWAAHPAGEWHGWHIGCGCLVSAQWKLRDASKALRRIMALYEVRADAAQAVKE